MIKRFEGVIPDGVVGCQIKTLVCCYRDIQNPTELYKSDDGGVLCRFGQTLLVSGKVDPDELFDFADTLGATVVEAIGTDAASHGGWSAKSHAVLWRGCGGNRDIPFLKSLKGCYDVICSVDRQFAKQAEYLYWLSDITRRQNCGCAKAYCRDGAAAVVAAAGKDEAYLSLVAVSPEKRGEGRAASLLNDVFSDSFLCGKRLFTAAQDEELIPFYQKLGFLRLDKSLIIFEKEHI